MNCLYNYRISICEFADVCTVLHIISNITGAYSKTVLRVFIMHAGAPWLGRRLWKPNLAGLAGFNSKI